MPRYHFNVVLGDKLISDQVAQACLDLEAAYHRASGIAREMLGSPRDYGVQWSEAVFYIVIYGQEIATMPFSKSAARQSE
jgi:hypothetical protein